MATDSELFISYSHSDQQWLVGATYPSRWADPALGVLPR